MLAAEVDPAPEVEPGLFPELDDESEADLPEADLPEPDLPEPDSPEPSEEGGEPAGFSELLSESPDFEPDLDPLAA